MKHLITILFIISHFTLWSQDTHKWLYKPPMMEWLTHVVDSLHQGFDTLSLQKTYRGIEQTIDDSIYMPVIPSKYARMIQYAEYMMDTTTTVFRKNAQATLFFIPYEEYSPAVREFMDYIRTHDEKNWWYAYKQDSLSQEREFELKLEAAVREALEGGRYDKTLEEYSAEYYHPKTALELRRRRRITRRCGLDYSREDHHLAIAQLSTKTKTWECFLQAHMDLMNDYGFIDEYYYLDLSRDPKPAYIAELDAIGMRVMDLVIGISLKQDHPAQNHYTPNIFRLGQALTDSAYVQTSVATTLSATVQDTALDPHNRLIIFYLFRSYVQCIPDPNKREAYQKLLDEAKASLPQDLVVGP